MHCYNKSIYISMYIRNWFSDTDKVWHVRDRGTITVSISRSIAALQQSVLTVLIVPYSASSRPGHYFSSSQESSQFPRHQPLLGPDDTWDQELTFLWRDTGWVGTPRSDVGHSGEGQRGALPGLFIIADIRLSSLSPQHNFLTESHKNPGLARVIPA